MNFAARKIPAILILLMASFPLSAVCQNLTGIWRGIFITEDGDEYRYELQIAHSKANSISGVSYSYLDTRFYGKATLTGNFTRSRKSALVQEIRTVEVKMAGGSTACIMKCSFVYSTSGKEAFLEGTYTSTFEEGLNRGKNCGGGKVFLRKVPTSDFYVEPFLRKKSEPVVREKTSIPLPKPPVTQAKPKSQTPNTTTRKPPVTTPQKNTTTTRKPVDTVSRRTNTPIEVNKPVIKSGSAPPTLTRSRTNELVKTVVVSNEVISVRLYDNGQIDGDTISVYLDGNAILSNKGLSTVPITLNISLDESNPEHTLVMVAENLGKIPPNTSLMIIQDGNERHQVSITSTEQKNAMVRFRYQKK